MIYVTMPALSLLRSYLTIWLYYWKTGNSTVVILECNGRRDVPDSIKLNGNSDELKNKRLTDAHGAILFAALTKKTFLTNLDISYNDLSNDSAQAIAKFLIVFLNQVSCK